MPPIEQPRRVGSAGTAVVSVMIAVGLIAGCWFVYALLMQLRGRGGYAYASRDRAAGEERIESAPVQSGRAARGALADREAPEAVAESSSADGEGDREVLIRAIDRSLAARNEQKSDPRSVSPEVRSFVLEHVAQAIDELERDMKRFTQERGEAIRQGALGAPEPAPKVDAAVQRTTSELEAVFADVRRSLASLAKRYPDQEHITRQKRAAADALREKSKRERLSGSSRPSPSGRAPSRAGEEELVPFGTGGEL